MPTKNASEWQVRKQLVDRALLTAGWQVVAHAQWVPTPAGAWAVEEYPTETGPADYALWLEGRAVGVVEAKKLTVGAQNVIEQAKRYARGFGASAFQFGEYRLPFAYATNGQEIFACDLRDPLAQTRALTRFHTPAALREQLARDLSAADLWLSTQPITDPDRPYQQQAIGAIERALRNGKRQMLIAMATGTGKTRMTIAAIYRLLKAGYARRVLFLVDRRALAAQAVSALAAYTPEPGLKFNKIYEVYSQRFRREDFDEDAGFDANALPPEYLLDPQPAHTFVYVSTIQRMRINLFGRPAGVNWAEADDEADAEQMDIPIHAFDLIIADECHRGYTGAEDSKWRAVLAHFDCIKIGLTATPAPHTATFFGLPVFRYESLQAVTEGYLVDYDAVKLESQIGMVGHFLREGEEVGLRDTSTGALRLDFVEDERDLPAATLDSDWTAPDRDRQLVAEVVRYLLAFAAERGHFPKTLVFAHNDLAHRSHADQWVRFLREALGRGDDFVQKITGSPSVDRPLEKIRRFRNRPAPGVVVTVDLLTTGVDIPALEALVFLRPVRSRILFEQMMGRGTRLCPAIGKTHYTVFDAVGVLNYFGPASAFTSEPPTQPTRPLREIVAALYNNEDRTTNTNILIKRLRRIEKNISAQGRAQLAAFIPEGDIGQLAQTLAQRLETDWTATLRLLRDPSFLALLENYPRATQHFLEAYEAADVVSSEYVFRTTDDRTLKPSDYIQAFTQFVRQNPAQVEALRILLERPREWNTAALKQLAAQLAARPERFTEANLRRAYHHTLADLISLVRHAAKDEPLLSAEARVHRALHKVIGNRELTPAQEKWLALIRRHLVTNLTIEQGDFEQLEFEQAGATWKRVNADFGGALAEILLRLNEAVAS